MQLTVHPRRQSRAEVPRRSRLESQRRQVTRKGVRLAHEKLSSPVVFCRLFLLNAVMLHFLFIFLTSQAGDGKFKVPEQYPEPYLKRVLLAQVSS